MKLTTTPVAALFAASLLALPALAQGGLNEEIVTATPEAQEDCEALRDSLKAERDDNVLNAADMRELRDKGC